MKEPEERYTSGDALKVIRYAVHISTSTLITFISIQPYGTLFRHCLGQVDKELSG